MRNKNAQNNGKDGEYGEGKNEKEKRAEIIHWHLTKMDMFGVGAIIQVVNLEMILKVRYIYQLRFQE